MFSFLFMVQVWTFLVILLFHLKYDGTARPEGPDGGLFAPP